MFTKFVTCVKYGANALAASIVADVVPIVQANTVHTWHVVAEFTTDASIVLYNALDTLITAVLDLFEYVDHTLRVAHASLLSGDVSGSDIATCVAVIMAFATVMNVLVFYLAVHVSGLNKKVRDVSNKAVKHDKQIEKVYTLVTGISNEVARNTECNNVRKECARLTEENKELRRLLESTLKETQNPEEYEPLPKKRSPRKVDERYTTSPFEFM